jgi:hypothetical protein
LLFATILAVGWDHDRRRQAAVAGLVVLERGEVGDDIRASVKAIAWSA